MVKGKDFSADVKGIVLTRILTLQERGSQNSPFQVPVRIMTNPLNQAFINSFEVTTADVYPMRTINLLIITY